MYKDEINTFKINNLNEKDISKLIININIFNGNIISNIIENDIYLKSNFQYLLTLKENNNIIYFENKDQRRGNVYVINFYNLNCKLNISKLYTKNKDELILNDNFAQETFTIYNGTYYSEYFNYELKIISSSDTDKSCFL